jgi:serine protease Do
VPKNTGVVVAEVMDHTPAAKAGIQAGDILTAIGGKTVKDARILQGIVADLPLKKATAVQLIRDSQPITTQVTIEELPKDFDSASAPVQRLAPTTPGSIVLDSIGVDVADMTDNMADDLGFKKGTHGVVITRVETGSVAAEAGLRKGMLIAKADNHKIAATAQLQQAMKTAALERGLLLQVQSPQGGTQYVLLKTSGAASEQ